MAYFDDDVNGQVIGGDYGMAWVTYEGRKQGATVYPANESEAYRMCADIKQEMVNECGAAFSVIYPHDAWQFHFDGV